GAADGVGLDARDPPPCRPRGSGAGRTKRGASRDRCPVSECAEGARATWVEPRVPALRGPPAHHRLVPRLLRGVKAASSPPAAAARGGGSGGRGPPLAEPRRRRRYGLPQPLENLTGLLNRAVDLRPVRDDFDGPVRVSLLKLPEVIAGGAGLARVVGGALPV